MRSLAPPLSAASWLALCLVLGLAGCRTRLLAGVSRVDQVQAARDATLEAYPWPEQVTAEERNRIEEALRTIFDVGGRDARDAEAYLVALDAEAAAEDFRAVGRIVTEMKHVIEAYGLDNLEGRSRLMVLDRILRKVDGVQERLFGEEYHYDIDESAARGMRLARAWNWWYREGRFLRRYKPWDPRVDMIDDPVPEDDEVED